MITLTQSQQLVADDPSKMKLVFKGRRWGATTLAIEEAVRHAAAGVDVLYVAPNYHMLRDAWNRLHDTYQNSLYYEHSSMSVFVGGVGRILFKTPIDAVRFQSPHVPISITVDEAEFCPANFWMEILRHPNSRILMLTSLKTHILRANWTVKLAFRILRGTTVGDLYTFDTMSNPHIDAKQIQESLVHIMSPIATKRDFYALSGGWALDGIQSEVEPEPKKEKKFDDRNWLR